MKKTLAIFMIFILMLSLSVTVFAEQKEDVYYMVPTQELIKMYEDAKDTVNLDDKRYVEKFILKDGEVYDPEKMTHDFSKLYKYIDFTTDSFRKLINADDIRKAILESEAKWYIYPSYYDGVLLEEYCEVHEISLNEYTGKYIFSNRSGSSLGSYQINMFTPKEKIEAMLQDKGLDGYELVYAMHLSGLPFAILEKDNEIFLTPLFNDEVKEIFDYSPIYKNLNKKTLGYLERPVMTIEETNEFLDVVDRISDKIRRVVGDRNLADGEVVKITMYPWDYAGISTGVLISIVLSVVLLIAAGIVTFVLIKKKKA